MKKSRIILCVLAISYLLSAKNVQPEQLAAFVGHHFPDKIIASSEKIGDGLVLTHFKNGGFVLTSQDDRFPAILAYSLKNAATGENPAFEEQCEQYNLQIEHVSDLYTNTHSDWNYSEKPSLSKSNVYSDVSPLITSTWNQSPHYNSKFPNFVLPGHENEKALVGCVAVVMGQIMKYYQHPSRGYGKRWYYSEATNTNMYADFDTSDYDYSNMPNSLCDEYGNLTVPIDQKDDVSKLLLQCATSVEMEFLPGASSSAYEDMMFALKSHFDYAPDMELKEKLNYTISEWDGLLQTELNAGKPIPYRGQGDGGHAFILDGYNTVSGTKYHINWGWGGSYDGWFSLSYLQATTGYDFSDHQAGIFNIQANSDDLTRYLHTGFEGLEAGWIYDGGGFYADQSGYDLARSGEMAYGFDGGGQWLISPKFQVPDHNNAMLSMWAFMLNSGRQCSVYLSTTDTNRTSFTHLLGTIAPSNSNWNEYSYSLRPYKNQNVYLGFLYNQVEGYITIDDIEVTRPKVLTSLENIPPENFDIIQAYPNPFNPSTKLRLDYGESGHSDIVVYNIQGKLIEHIYNGYVQKGKHEIIWDASSFPAGIYICSLSLNGNLKDTQKLLLVK